MVNVHPKIDLRAVCDTSGYVLDVISKYTGVRAYADYKKLLAEEELDCVFVATPSRFHAEVVAAALDRGLHVFCEKPFALDPAVGFELAEKAERSQLINQVGYHYRFVAAFNEAKRLLDRKIIGDLHHVRAEAYGPVVLRPKGSTWRSQRDEGGGCLFDYSCHAIDLLNYLIGSPVSVSGSVLNRVFSSDVEDEIYSTLQFSDGLYGQLATNWSDDSFRKMSVKVNVWGSRGRISVDRQEIQVYLRTPPEPTEEYKSGWNIRYTTDLTPPVWFYVRGEEYSSQIDHFVQCIEAKTPTISSFRTASDASLVAAMIREDAHKPRTVVARPGTGSAAAASAPSQAGSGRSFLRGLFQRFGY
jgi:predicted dehydrogenase